MTGNSCSQTLLNLPLDMFHILVLFSLYSVFLGRWYRRRGNMMTCVKYTHELWLKMTDHDPKICSAAQAILKLILVNLFQMVKTQLLELQKYYWESQVLLLIQFGNLIFIFFSPWIHFWKFLPWNLQVALSSTLRDGCARYIKIKIPSLTLTTIKMNFSEDNWFKN